MIIVLFGAPGVGKGTQAAILAERLNIPHLSTGDAFRQAIKSETPVGLLAKRYVDAGELVPDTVVAQIVEEALSQPRFLPGALLDGFPRTRPQADALSEILSKQNRDIHSVVNIQVDNSAIIERLLLRGRADDSHEVIQHRLDVYQAETQPLLDYYASKGVLVSIDGKGAVADVTQRILSVLPTATA
jgi:adenylate kinase